MKNIILLTLLIIIIVFYIYSYFIDNKKYKIKNLDKYWTNNIESDILIISQYTPEIKDYAQHSIKNYKYYCNKHKYKLLLFDKHLCKDVHPCWYKIILLNHLIPKTKYIVWIDCDAIITNPNIRIEEFIQGDYELFVCRDINPNRTLFNSGVMIFKNTNNTRNLLNKVWNYDGIHGYTPHGDQDILNKYVKKIPIKMKVYDMNKFNSHPRKYKEGDFILHLMVRDTKKRAQVMKDFNNYLKITNNNDKIKCINNKRCLGEHKINCDCRVCKKYFD